MCRVSGRIKAHFMTALGLSDASAEGLIGASRAALRDGLAALDDALAHGDREKASHWAHSLKGNLLNAGLPELAEIAARMEAAAEASPLDGHTLREEFKRLEAELAAFLAAG